MAVSILGRASCGTCCTNAKVIANTIAQLSSSITFSRARRLLSYTISVIGDRNNILVTGNVSPPIGSVANFFQDLDYGVIGSYQVNIEVEDPRGGCRELITFTTVNPSPDVGPIPPIIT